MKLTIKDRLNFGILYPQQGNILTQLLVKSIAEKVELEQDEIKEIELKQEENQLTWEQDKAKELEVEFTEAEINLLKEQVKLLDEKKEIALQNLDLCLKIQDYKKEPVKEEVKEEKK